MSWLILFLAGFLEVAWAIGLKLFADKPVLLAVTVAISVASVALLGVAMKQIPLGTAYAVWTGIGILGTFGFGVAVLGEPFTAAKLFWAALILAGIIGLKLA